MEKRRFAQVGTGTRAPAFYNAIAKTYKDTCEMVAICDVNQGRMDYTNRCLEAMGVSKVPTYKHYEFEKMVAETKPDCIIVTSVDRTHDDYIVRAMELGCDVITEKPMTIDEKRAQRIIDTQKKTGRDVRVAFNYRYAPDKTKVRELIMNGTIGDVYAVHFEWFLDTVHGADYYRRWHRQKENSGGLLVHKATHHFDLVNFWLGTQPETVFAMGGLNFYGRTNAERRGVKNFFYRYYGNEEAKKDPFYFDIENHHPLIKALFFECEKEDGYIRDKSVFSEEITIEDTMGVMVRYRSGAVMTYSLVSYSPLEGCRVSFTGTKGRIDFDNYKKRSDEDDGSGLSPVHDEIYDKRIMVHPLFDKSYEVEIPTAEGGHGGGDPAMMENIFGDQTKDPFHRAANHVDGAMSILTGVAANKSIASGLPVQIDALVKF